MNQPINSDDFLKRGISKIENGAVEEGLEDLNIAIKKKKNNIIAYKRRGIVRRDTLGDYAGAIEDFNKELRIRKRLGGEKLLTRIYVDLGITYQLLEQHQNAVDFFSKAINTDPQSIQAYKLRGQSRKNIDDLEGSREDFQTASDLVNPDSDLQKNELERIKRREDRIDQVNTVAEIINLLIVQPLVAIIKVLVSILEAISNFLWLVILIVIVVAICMLL